MRKTLPVLAILVVAGALLLIWTLVLRIQVLECNDAHDLCLRQCDSTLNRALDEHQRRRTQILLGLLRDFEECRSTSPGNQAAITKCQVEKTNAANNELVRLDELDAVTRRRHQDCVTNCDNQARECHRNSPAQTVSTDPEIIKECLPGGPPCRADVPEICTQISEPCRDCGRSLCGGGEWAFDTEAPGVTLDVNLVADTRPSKNPRVLATSSVRGKQAVLSVPSEIKLDTGEQLYFGFSSKEKTERPFNVLIRRSR